MLSVDGTFQVPLVRLFDKKSHAAELAYDGKARLTRIDLFREMEVPRRDESEGIGRLGHQEIPFVKWGTSPMHASVEVVTKAPVYVLSFFDASADLDRLAGPRKYGVRIQHPTVLNSALPSLTVDSVPSDRRVVSLRVAQVQYDKGAKRHLSDFLAAFPLAFMQKEPRFADEKEWRLALLLSGEHRDSPDYLYVTIPFAQRFEVFEL